MSDLDRLFDICERESSNKILTGGELIIDNVEKEFAGIETPSLSKEKEKAKLQDDKKRYEKELKGLKNPTKVSNPSRRRILTEQTSKKRDKLRAKISSIELRLSEIDTEEGKHNDDKPLTTKDRLKKKVEGNEKVKEQEAKQRSIDLNKMLYDY